MTGRQPPPPPAYYEKVPEERDSFEALPLLESGPSLLGPLAPTTTSPTSRAVPEEEQQQEQETYPPPEPLPWSPGEVRHHVTYRLRPLPSQAHLAADCAGVLGRSHEETIGMVRRAFPTALRPIPTPRILLSLPSSHTPSSSQRQHASPAAITGGTVRLSPDWFDAMFAPRPSSRRREQQQQQQDQQRPPALLADSTLAGLGGLWNGLVEAFAYDEREWPTLILVEVEPTEADVRLLQETASVAAAASLQDRGKIVLATAFLVVFSSLVVVLVVHNLPST